MKKRTKVRKFRIGDVVLDNCDCLAVIYQTGQKPESAEWLADQSDARCHALASDDWYSAIPFDGGAVLVPGSLVTFVRKITRDDLLAIIRGRHECAEYLFTKLFS